jgi:hypothetical protein
VLAHPQVVIFPRDVEQHQGEWLFHTGQGPQGHPPNVSILFFHDEAPLGAHGPGGEHTPQVLPDFFTVVWVASGLDEEVEFVGTDGAGAHLYEPPVTARLRGELSVRTRLWQA